MLAIILALALAIPGGASASNRQQMVLQDDQQLVYASPSHVADVLKTLSQMGVDRVRVSVVWSLVAPDPTSSQRPNFDATNPAAYPAGAWSRYDFLVRVAAQDGVAMYFQPTAPAPYWATQPLKVPQGYRYANQPSAKEYGEFVQAVATRYSGHYVAPNISGSGSSPLPAVTYWGIYNEPNIGGWMTPQWKRIRGGKQVQASPAIYRRMLDTAWSALMRTGHRHDTILIGETAAYGAGHKDYGASMDPLTFVRAFYCLGSNYTPLHGRAATEIACPKSGNRRAFVRAHPAMFHATGWAHHPYDFTYAPSHRRGDPNSATLSGLGRIETALDRSDRAYHHRGGIPIYITEWGVQSRTPDPFIQFSQAQQATYINEGEYMAWKNQRVRSFGQFLLIDASPNPLYAVGSRAYWATFQSGLFLYNTDQPKPAYYAFELPLWLPHPRHGKHVSVWAQIRPRSPRSAQLQFQARGSHTWSNVASVSSNNPEGFITTHLSLRSAGGLRMVWNGPGGVFVSRTAHVR